MRLPKTDISALSVRKAESSPAPLPVRILHPRAPSVSVRSTPPTDHPATLMSAIVEGSTDAIFVKDLEGRYILVNGAAARFLGRKACAILGRTDMELFPPASAAETVENDRRVLLADRTETYESVTICNGVTVHYLSTKFPCRDTNGVVTGIVGIARDVTASKVAGDLLREQRDLYEALVASQSDLGIALVVATGTPPRARFVNDAYCAMSGYTRAELEALPSLLQLLPPDRVDAMAARSARRRDGNAEPERYDTAIVHKSGARIDVEIATKPLGTSGDLLVMLRDVTEERRARAQLMTSDRLSAVGCLAAGVAHEINNPLAYVVNNIDEVRVAVAALVSKHGGVPELREPLERIVRAVEDAREGAGRVTTIVRDLGTFSRAPDEGTTTFDLRSAVRSSVRLTNNTVRHRAKVVMELGDVPPVHGNEARLGQVLVNLLVNAAQAIPEGASVEGLITVRTRTDVDGRAIIEVTDTGVGIAAENLKKIFEPFYTTKPQGTGTGLGLAVCLGIVRGMGGELGVQSTPGRGSTFRVSLRPSRIEAASSASSGTLRAASMLPMPLRPRILVVDDEPALAQSLQRVLARDYDVEVCGTSRDALARLSGGTLPDLVLCDLMMPGESGYDLHSAAAALDPSIAARFLFLSGGAVTPQLRRFAAELGERCLSKPILPADLRAAVARAIRRLHRSAVNAATKGLE